MKVVVVPFGTTGDFLPYLAVARYLVEQEVEVLLVANPVFRQHVDCSRLEFVPLGTAEEYEGLIREDGLSESRRALASALAHLGATRHIPALYDLLKRRVTSCDAILASPLAFGCRIASEDLGIPLVSLVLQPFALRRAYREPKEGNPLERDLLREINAFRSSLGRLEPVTRLLGDWALSPQKIIGLFPDWFAPAIAPSQKLQLLGFLPLEWSDDDGLARLAEFASAGEPPLLFAPSSALKNVRVFFDAALKACEALERRAVFVTPFADSLPSLPSSIVAVSALPLIQMARRAAAVVHHGGIGTCAAALAGGAPQLVCPRAGDQLDNGFRLRRLGVASIVQRQEFSSQQLAERLRPLICDEELRVRCASLAERVVPAPDLGEMLRAALESVQ